MLVRGLALSLSVAMASIAQADVVVNLVRTPDQATYTAGQVVDVEVFLAQDTVSADHYLRQIQFDLNASDSALPLKKIGAFGPGIDLVKTHLKGTLTTQDDVFFWSFGSIARCAATPSTCGEKHFLVHKFATCTGGTQNGELCRVDADCPGGTCAVIAPGTGILSATYGIDTQFDPLVPPTVKLTQDTTIQIKLPGNQSSVKVGQLQITLPVAAGSYTLDLLNLSESNVDKGGQVRFGFSLAGTETITRWRASAGQMTGGTYTFVVGGDRGACCDTTSGVCTDDVAQASCGGAGQVWTQGVLCANLNPPCVAANAVLVSSDPACGISWPRSANNFAKLEFSKDLVLPGAGQVQIRELLAAGAFGADLSANFTFSIVNNGGGQPRVLRIVENGTQLTDRRWYGISDNGWAGVDPFEVDIVHLIGDADGNGRVLGLDVSLINSQISPLPQPDKRTDIDGNGRVLGLDFSLANSKISPLAVTKPTGHSCSP